MRGTTIVLAGLLLLGGCGKADDSPDNAPPRFYADFEEACRESAQRSADFADLPAGELGEALAAEYRRFLEELAALDTPPQIEEEVDVLLADIASYRDLLAALVASTTPSELPTGEYIDALEAGMRVSQGIRRQLTALGIDCQDAFPECDVDLSDLPGLARQTEPGSPCGAPEDLLVPSAPAG